MVMSSLAAYMLKAPKQVFSLTGAKEANPRDLLTFNSSELIIISFG